MTKELDELVVDSIYDILVESTEIDWPEYFTVETKTGFLEHLVEEFRSREEYIKCDKMQALLDTIKK